MKEFTDWNVEVEETDPAKKDKKSKQKKTKEKQVRNINIESKLILTHEKTPYNTT